MKVTTLSQKNKGKTCNKMSGISQNLSEKLTIEEVETYIEEK